MNEPLRLGIIGCGDFLRLQQSVIDQSGGIRVAALYDPARERAEKFAAKWPGSRVCDSAEDLLADEGIDMAGIFVPPWLRKPLVCEAARRGKAIVTTKPLGATGEECREMIDAVEKAGVAAGVIYNRTASRKNVTLRRVFESGRFGRLALFKQDWIHHYPVWNTWALDPEKNGGPFMDAMIHNLNIARYLMGRPVTRGTMFSDRHAHPDLPCADTEFLKLDFTENGSAHLFITWAADLRVDDATGNFREHIDLWYAVTDQGWRITEEIREGETVLAVSRKGVTEIIPLDAIEQTPYEAIAIAMRERSSHLGTLASLREAAEDIEIIRKTGARPGVLIRLP